MTHRLLAVLAAAGLATVAPVTAHADGPGYTGSCGITVATDPTANLGGESTWSGEVHIRIAATTPGDTITEASCWIKVTASGAETDVLHAAAGGPVASGAGGVSYRAAVSDTVYLCTHVAIGVGATDNCVDIVKTPVCLVAVCGPNGVLSWWIGRA
jgi:hypothetical protein